MFTKKTHHCQFYAWSRKYQERTLFSFRVENENDARKCLKRFNQKAGWYVVRDDSGNPIVNKKIYP